MKKTLVGVFSVTCPSAPHKDIAAPAVRTREYPISHLHDAPIEPSPARQPKTKANILSILQNTTAPTAPTAVRARSNTYRNGASHANVGVTLAGITSHSGIRRPGPLDQVHIVSEYWVSDAGLLSIGKPCKITAQMWASSVGRSLMGTLAEQGAGGWGGRCVRQTTILAFTLISKSFITSRALRMLCMCKHACLQGDFKWFVDGSFSCLYVLRLLLLFP
jgi:hypothetical protein